MRTPLSRTGRFCRQLNAMYAQACRDHGRQSKPARFLKRLLSFELGRLLIEHGRTSR